MASYSFHHSRIDPIIARRPSIRVRSWMKSLTGFTPGPCRFDFRTMCWAKMNGSDLMVKLLKIKNNRPSPPLPSITAASAIPHLISWPRRRKDGGRICSCRSADGVKG